MKISPGLLLKSMMGAAAATAATTAASYGENIYSFFITGSFGIVDESKKEESLNLPLGESCKWPDRYSSEPALCELNVDKLKGINFYEGGSKTISDVEGGENFILTIERLWNDRVFDKGYKFILKSKEGNNDVTVKQNSQPFFYLPKDMNLEFKIREDGGKWYLERAWDEKAIRERIGLDCQSNSCSLKDGRKINVMIGDSKVEGISNLNNKTIKLHKNTKDYQQGLKFSIEKEDIPLNVTNAKIKKFEKDETYEIKLVGNKWYLSRKISAIDVVNEKLKNLGLPVGCKMNEEGKTVGCDEIKTGGLGNINFENKTAGSTLTATNANSVTLKIERTEDTETFPNGVKIVFENSEDVTINNGGGSSLIDWKKGTNPEYKIEGSGTSKTLKKAWGKVSDLADKSGMTNCNSGSCTITKSINVRDGYKTSLRRNMPDHSKTLKYQENQAEYNQGFKFTAETNHSFAGGEQNGISMLKKGATYEVKELYWGGKKQWFLIKKTLSEEEQKIVNEINKNITDLGITKAECKFKGDEEVKTCELDSNALKNVKFEGKNSGSLTTTSSDNFVLKMEKILQSGSGFEAGKLKFTFTSIPSDVTYSSDVFLKKDTNPVFKIKKGSGSNLTLEGV